MNVSEVRILSGGAAQGLVAALAPRFKAATGCEIAGTFGAVGAMRDKLIGGEQADLLILTRALIDDLAAQGHVAPDSTVDIGTVQTAVAVRSGNPVPAIVDGAGLRSALLAADAIYFPDPKLATAGIHFSNVLERLGIAAEVAARLRTFPNGATAMRELGATKIAHPIGCTQVTEILTTPGVTLAAALPQGLELATVYTAAICTRAALPRQAQELAALLAGAEARHERQRAGFV